MKIRVLSFVLLLGLTGNAVVLRYNYENEVYRPSGAQVLRGVRRDMSPNLAVEPETVTISAEGAPRVGTVFGAQYQSLKRPPSVVRVGESFEVGGRVLYNEVINVSGYSAERVAVANVSIVSGHAVVSKKMIFPESRRRKKGFLRLGFCFTYRADLRSSSMRSWCKTTTVMVRCRQMLTC